MRLINTASLRLERFDDDTKIPPYAILSHTWGSDEISLQQLQDAAAGDEPVRNCLKDMLGFAKIVKACERALEDQYAHIWVDTCCIDKTSSAELSEAINSMFRWYKKAQVCYAFLEDFTPRAQPVCKTESEISQAIIRAEEHMATARWFGRGWTLQELIAPRHVRFYDADWSFIGTKATLFKQLARITGIDRLLLSGDEALEDFSVAKRMSWAANRTTTRVEDMAYSLMGMFDVNMPLLYGEGEKAFTRLQEEILKESDDQSLFAWSPTLHRPVLIGVRDRRRGRGMPIFAKHPREFAQAKDIYPQSTLGEPTTMTNKGVRVDLPILKLRSIPQEGIDKLAWGDFFLAVLYCSYVRDKRKHPAIVLRGFISETGSHVYIRHESAGIFAVTHDEVRSSDMRQIYLRRQPRKGAREHLEYETSSVAKLYERVTYTEPRVYQLKGEDEQRRVQYDAMLEHLSYE